MSVEERIRSIFPAEEDIPEEFRLAEPVRQKEYLINGSLRIWQGNVQEVLSPVCISNSAGFSQKVLGSYPLLSEKESREALEAALRAYDYGRGIWPSLPMHERIDAVRSFLVRMQSKKEEIVRLLMWETGKSFEGAEREFERTLDYIRKIISVAATLEHNTPEIREEEGFIGWIRNVPLGVVLCMGPFNYPLFETFTTVMPALIMGNAVLMKPPKLGVLLHYPLLPAFRDSFPPGVVNTISGETDEIIPPLFATGKIDCLAFTGTGKGADVLKSSHPNPHRLRSVLGLEAKNPAIILPDADIDLTVRECLKGSLGFNGQRCTALKILFVHSDIADVFLRQFAQGINALKIGMPWEQGVFITPLPEPGKPHYLTELVEDALQKGAVIVNESGGRVNRTFYYPALVYPVNKQMRIYHEEQFGPLIPVVSFDDIRNPLEYVIQSNFGQQVSIFGNNQEIISELVNVLMHQVCRINVNCKCQRGPDSFPFSGKKDSGEGTLSVSDALQLFSVKTVVAAKQEEGVKDSGVPGFK